MPAQPVLLVSPPEPPARFHAHCPQLETILLVIGPPFPPRENVLDKDGKLLRYREFHFRVQCRYDIIQQIGLEGRIPILPLLAAGLRCRLRERDVFRLMSCSIDRYQSRNFRHRREIVTEIMLGKHCYFRIPQIRQDIPLYICVRRASVHLHNPSINRVRMLFRTARELP